MSMPRTIVLPDQTSEFTAVAFAALTLYREASGQSTEEKIGIACVFRNRVLHPSWYGQDWCSVLTKKAQFTSMVPPDKVDDPNLRRWPKPGEAAWEACVSIVIDVMFNNLPDVTGGATFYFAKSMDAHPPAWAKLYTHLCDIGDTHFYKPAKDGQ